MCEAKTEVAFIHMSLDDVLEISACKMNVFH